MTLFPCMDDKTKARLERIRLRTPRYLFRAWKDSHSDPSGGYQTLNSPNAIIPLAFRVGRGHSSIHDISEKELADMVVKHLLFLMHDFFTELSSWTASLSYALRFFGDQNDDVFISMIDTTALRSQNEIFFVPDLDFLKPGKMKRMHHEYVVHGPVRGPAHRAVPLSVFLLAGIDPHRLPIPGAISKSRPPRPLSNSQVQVALSVGRHYGYQFAAPLTLALLALEKRIPPLFLRDGDAGFEMILDALDGLYIPPGWRSDDTIMADLVYVGNYLDIRQFIDLMRTAVRHQVRSLSIQDRSTHEDGVTDSRNRMAARSFTDRNCIDVIYKRGPLDGKRYPSPQMRLTTFKWFIRFINGKANIIQRSQEGTARKNILAPLVNTVARHKITKINIRAGI